MKILVVDDDCEFVSMLVQTLPPKHRVIGITGSSHLVEWVTHRGFDLVLLAIPSAETNDFTLLSQLKGSCPGVFVILMAGLNTDTGAVPTRSVSADYLLTKPIDVGQLVEILDNLEDLQGRATKKPDGD